MTLLIFIAVILLIVGMFYASYRTANYYLVNYILNGRIWQIFSKEFLIAAGLIVITFFLWVYFGLLREPDYIEQGVDQLRRNKFVKSKIDHFRSYTFKPDDLPKNQANDAVFQIALNATDTLFLTCTMKKIGDDWKLIKIQQDSVHKGND